MWKKAAKIMMALSPSLAAAEHVFFFHERQQKAVVVALTLFKGVRLDV